MVELHTKFEVNIINQMNTGVPELLEKKIKRLEEKRQIQDQRKKKMIFKENVNARFQELQKKRAAMNEDPRTNEKFHRNQSQSVDDDVIVDPKVLYGDEIKQVENLVKYCSPIDMNIKKFVFMSLYKPSHESASETCITNFNFMSIIPKGIHFFYSKIRIFRGKKLLFDFGFI